MASALVVVGVVLCVGWGLWWWLLRGHLEQTSAMLKRLEELEQRHESE